MSKVLFYVGGCNRAVSYFATSNATGISAFRLDTETGSVETLGVTGGIDNPTFLAVAPDGNLFEHRIGHRAFDQADLHPPRRHRFGDFGGVADQGLDADLGMAGAERHQL